MSLQKMFHCPSIVRGSACLDILKRCSWRSSF